MVVVVVVTASASQVPPNDTSRSTEFQRQFVMWHGVICCSNGGKYKIPLDIRRVKWQFKFLAFILIQTSQLGSNVSSLPCRDSRGSTWLLGSS